MIVTAVIYLLFPLPLPEEKKKNPREELAIPYATQIRLLKIVSTSHEGV